MAKPLHLWMALAYLFTAAVPVYQAIRHTNIEMMYLKQTYEADNLQNNGALKEAAFWKEMTAKHHYLGHWIKSIFEPAIDQQFQLPSGKEAREKLGEIPGLNELGKK